MSEKKVILSGIQPSGAMTLGTYLGALRNWAKLSEELDCYYAIVDMHAIVARQDPSTLRKTQLEQLAQYIACGIDPEKNTLFIQSHVPAHAQLAWILNCYTMFGELSRMTQFKDKSSKNEDNINAGLFTYPVLQAADILIYQADLVPVGEDQKQHVEFTRNLAERFNNKYGDTFVIPEPIIPKIGARIMDLQDPTKKMSKSSDSNKGNIYLLDDLEVARKKIMSAVTDNIGKVQYDPENQPGISNLIQIYASLTNMEIKDVVNLFKDASYGEFKKAVADVVVSTLKEIQTRYNEIMNSGRIDEILDQGLEKTTRIAKAKYEEVVNKVGLGR